MKGLNKIITALVVVVVVFGLVLLITKGAEATINFFKYKTADIDSTIDVNLVPQGMESFCRLECKNCCMMAEGTDEERTGTCNSVLANTFYEVGEEKEPCSQYYNCNC